MHELGIENDPAISGATATPLKPLSWQLSGVRRSSSVQSNSSVGSHRSQSPSTDRAANVGLRPSPRPCASAVRLSSGGTGGTGSNRESPAKVGASRSGAYPSERSARGAPSPGSSPPLHAPRGHAAREVSPRPARFGGGPPAATGSMTSARRSTPHSAGGTMGAPQNASPRLGGSTSGHTGLSEAVRSGTAPKRQIVPGAKSRRSPSQDPAVSSGHKGVGGSFLSQVKAHAEKSIDECAASEQGVPLSLPLHSAMSSSPRPKPGSIARSRSLQSIKDVTEGGGSLPQSSRGSRNCEPQTARPRQITPLHSCRSQPQTARAGTAPRVGRMSSAANIPSSGSGGTGTASPTLRRAQHARSSVPLPSGRRMAPSESSATLRHADAGSGGTCGADTSLGASRSSPVLDVRTVHGRLGTPATSRPTPPARSLVR